MKQLRNKINTVIIIPGVPGNGPNHWQKWLADQCMDKLNLKTFYPQLKDGEDRKISNWLKTLEGIMALITETEKTALSAIPWVALRYCSY